MFTLQRTSSVTLEKSPNFSGPTFLVFNLSGITPLPLNQLFFFSQARRDGYKKDWGLGGGGVKRGIIWIGRHPVESILLA